MTVDDYQRVKINCSPIPQTHHVKKSRKLPMMPDIHLLPVRRL